MKRSIQCWTDRLVAVATVGVALSLPIAALAQSEGVTTIAGAVLTSGSADGPVATARFGDPAGLDIDATGNLYIADNANHTIRKLTPSGMVSTLAGAAGQFGSRDATGTNALFDGPSGIVLAPNGLLYVTDTGNNTIRCITTGGAVTTLAGSSGQSGATNATGSAARFNSPLGIAVDKSGTLYVADSCNHLIRKVTAAGVVTTLAGAAGVWGAVDGTNSAALFNSPAGVAVDSVGNVFVSDSNNHAIRKITPLGLVTTWAGQLGVDGNVDGTGNGALFSKPGELKIDRNNTLYVVDAFNHTLRRIDTNAVVTTIAGVAGNSGSQDGLGQQARFFNPYGLAVDHNGNLRVADTYNETVRFAYSTIAASLSSAANGNGFVISWQAIAGDTYQVQYKNMTNGSTWQNLGAIVTASASIASQTDNSVSSTSQRLYRVKLLP